MELPGVGLIRASTFVAYVDTPWRFASKQALAGLFLRLLEFALLTFSPQKIFSYLGRRLSRREI